MYLTTLISCNFLTIQSFRWLVGTIAQMHSIVYRRIVDFNVVKARITKLTNSQLTTLNSKPSTLNSFIQLHLPSPHSLKQPHPLIIGFIKYQGVHIRWLLPHLMVSSFLASRQQQGGKSRHCYCENHGCRCFFHGLSYYRDAFRLRNSL